MLGPVAFRRVQGGPYRLRPGVPRGRALGARAFASPAGRVRLRVDAAALVLRVDAARLRLRPGAATMVLAADVANFDAMVEAGP